MTIPIKHANNITKQCIYFSIDQHVIIFIVLSYAEKIKTSYNNYVIIHTVFRTKSAFSHLKAETALSKSLGRAEF